MWINWFKHYQSPSKHQLVVHGFPFSFYRVTAKSVPAGNSFDFFSEDVNQDKHIASIYVVYFPKKNPRASNILSGKLRMWIRINTLELKNSICCWRTWNFEKLFSCLVTRPRGVEPNGLNQIQPGVRSCEAWTTFDVDSHIDDTYDTFFYIFYVDKCKIWYYWFVFNMFIDILYIPVLCIAHRKQSYGILAPIDLICIYLHLGKIVQRSPR